MIQIRAELDATIRNKEAADQKDQTLLNLQKTNQELKQENTTLNNNIKDLKGRNEVLTRQNNQKEYEIKKMNQYLDIAKEKDTAFTAENKELKNEIQKLDAAAATSKKNLDTAVEYYKNQIEKIKAVYENNIADLTENLNSLKKKYTTDMQALDTKWQNEVHTMSKQYQRQMGLIQDKSVGTRKNPEIEYLIKYTNIISKLKNLVERYDSQMHNEIHIYYNHFILRLCTP